MDSCELDSHCPACGSHALRLAKDSYEKKWKAVVFGCVFCRLYWIRGDHVWIEEDSAGDLAELIGRPRADGVTIALRKRIDERVTPASTGHLI